MFCRRSYARSRPRRSKTNAPRPQRGGGRRKGGGLGFQGVWVEGSALSAQAPRPRIEGSGPAPAGMGGVSGTCVEVLIASPRPPELRRGRRNVPGGERKRQLCDAPLWAGSWVALHNCSSVFSNQKPRRTATASGVAGSGGWRGAWPSSACGVTAGVLVGGESGSGALARWLAFFCNRRDSA